MNKNLKSAFCLSTMLLSGLSVISAAEKNTPTPIELVTPSKNVLTVIESNQPHDLNPFTSNYSSDAQILVNIFEGLFSYDPQTLDPLPAVCTDYRISRDKKRWTFHLRENARFSDGSKITAYDVKRSWLTLLQTPGAPYSSMLDMISGAEAYRTGRGKIEDVEINVISDTSLSIRLTSACPYLPKLLCHNAFSVVPANPTVYSGPFFIEDMNDSEILLYKNPYYWDAENVELEKVIFEKSLGTEDNTFLFNTGLSELIYSHEINTDKLLDKEAVQINAQFGTEYLFFKVSNTPSDKVTLSTVWDMSEFRQALMEAMPWEILRNGNWVQASTFVYPLSGYPKVEGFSYTDENEALLLMKDARKKYGIPDDTKIPLHICISENGLSQKTIEALDKAMNHLGVALTIQFVPGWQYLDIIKVSPANIFAYNWIGDFADPMAFLELFRGDSTMNESNWKNTEYDELLKKAANEDGISRYNLLAQAETVLLENAMVFPICHSVSLSVIDTKEISGWYQNAFNVHPLKYIRKRPIKSNIPNVVLN